MPSTNTIANFHQRTPATKKTAAPTNSSMPAVPRSGCFSTRPAGTSAIKIGGISTHGRPISS
jgi:hypothetical protein